MPNALSPVTETVKRLNLPQYYQSPYYETGQKALSTLGGGLLTGDLPEYYKPLGEYGGTEFDKMLASIKTDVSKGVYEDLARRGGRGGLATSVIGKTMGGIGTKLRWEDMLRAMSGRKAMLGLGAEVMTGVRGAGLTEAGQRQTFGLSQAQLGLGAEKFEQELGWGKEKFGQQMELEKQKLALAKQQIEDAKKAQKSQMWSSILSSALGAAGTIGGFMLGGPLGAAGGSQLSRLFGGGESVYQAGGKSNLELPGYGIINW